MVMFPRRTVAALVAILGTATLVIAVAIATGSSPRELGEDEFAVCVSYFDSPPPGMPASIESALLDAHTRAQPGLDRVAAFTIEPDGHFPVAAMKTEMASLRRDPATAADCRGVLEWQSARPTGD
jgi:hypothetical protein